MAKGTSEKELKEKHMCTVCTDIGRGNTEKTNPVRKECYSHCRCSFNTGKCSLTLSMFSAPCVTRFTDTKRRHVTSAPVASVSGVAVHVMGR